MESRAIKIHSRYSGKVAIKIIPGHFATTHSHINYYIDITSLKIRQTEALEAARCLAAHFSVSTPVDTIVCMDGMEVIGAFLAQCLTENGIQTNIHYPIPPHRQECYKKWNTLSFPITEKIHREELSLPMSPVITEKDMEEVVSRIKEF